MFVGFVLATVFIGWSDGTYNNIIDKFTRNNFGHIQIHEKSYLDKPSLYKTINNFSEIEKRIKKIKNIDSWAPRIYSAGLASVKEKSTGVRIVGVDPKNEIKTTGFDRKVTEGRSFSESQKNETLIGKGLANILKAKLNDELVIVTQGADGSIANDLYNIVGIVEMGDDVSNRTALYLNIKDAQELLVLENRIHEIAITVNSLKHVLKISENLKHLIQEPELAIAPWQVFARSFYAAMKADQEGMYYTLIIIVLVVAVGVLNTVLMMVLERRREYGVLKAIGTRPKQIIKLVLTEVNILAVFSIIVGMIAGWVINSILSKHGLSMAEPISYGGMKIQHLLSEINARMFYIPAITVFLSATVVGFFPALMAARTEPAKTMRMH